MSRYSALPLCVTGGPNTSCLHPSSITRGGSFFGQGPPEPSAFKGQRPRHGQSMRYAAPWVRGDQFELVGEMFTRSSVAVATSREGHRTPAQDISDATMRLRQLGLVPWWWITDESRDVSTRRYAASVYDYIVETV